MTVRILTGDVRAVLKTLADDSVDCCITSPPYWGLRSYLPADHPQKHLEIGSEPTVQEWVRTLAQVFEEVRRVLKPKGTLWLNLGDSYAGGFRGGHRIVPSRRRDKVAMPRSDRAQVGLKPKDMVGQPWRAALALQGHAVIDCKSIGEWADLLQQARSVGDWSLVEVVEKRLRAWDFTESMKHVGWWLRQEIIWAKRSPMPESVRDRFTKAHEHVFLLAKSEHYYFDFRAIQEPASMGAHERMASTGVGFGRGYDDVQKPRAKHPHGWAQGQVPHDAVAHAQAGQHPKTRNAALATSGNDGACAEGKSARMGSGAGWRLAGNKTHKFVDAFNAGAVEHRTKGGLLGYDERLRRKQEESGGAPATHNPRSVRWLASEPFRGAHFATYPPELIRPFVRAGCPPGGTVLDPFGGSGTTGLVADQEGRNAILIDLDERNAPMASGRITAGAPLLAQVDIEQLEKKC